MKNQTALPLTSESLSFQRDNPIYVFGHRNPDSDAICSALVVADWLNYTGRPA
ncbi:pyrophosphatase, partial [Salmonella enterica subsp. enterica serovar Enteritidis]|nr:pyrophosphatase [Salmonella enterica subsp. enterica serovar Enteritidis]